MPDPVLLSPSNNELIKSALNLTFFVPIAPLAGSVQLVIRPSTQQLVSSVSDTAGTRTLTFAVSRAGWYSVLLDAKLASTISPFTSSLPSSQVLVDSVQYDVSVQFQSQLYQLRKAVATEVMFSMYLLSPFGPFCVCV